MKNELLKQYEPIGYDKIIMDNGSSFKLKNTNNERSYINLSLKNQICTIEVYNVKSTPMQYSQKDEKETTSSTSHTLIELSKLVEKGLLTKEEFEEQKIIILNKN